MKYLSRAAFILFAVCAAHADPPVAVRRGNPALTGIGAFNAMGPPVPMISYDGRYLPGEKSPVWTENRAGISLPLMRKAEGTVAASIGGSQLHLSENIHLDSGLEVPAELSRVEVGLQYFHQMQERNWGLRASVGYAGDKPFRTSRDLTYNFSASYGFPGSDSGYWSVFVFLANNSPLLNYLPIPGVIYIYRTPTFTGMFGFPILSMRWTPRPMWAYSLSVFGPTLVSEAAYGSRETVQTFAGFSVVQQSFIPSARVEDRERLTLQEDKLSLGARSLFTPDLLAELQIGRSFDRSIYEGKGFRNKDRGKISLAADWFLAGSMKWAF